MSTFYVQNVPTKKNCDSRYTNLKNGTTTTSNHKCHPKKLNYM